LFAGQYHSMNESNRDLPNLFGGALSEVVIANVLVVGCAEGWEKPMGDILLCVCTCSQGAKS
jgi:hypothetical protein